MNIQRVNRFEEFREIKTEIRGSRDHLIVGIDIAKNKHHAFFGTATGKTLCKRFVFDNSMDGYEKLLLQARLSKANECLTKVVFGLEPTANYHKPLGDFLVRHGYSVVLVSSNAVKKNRELLDGRWDKNDTKDAANVSDLISQGKCLYYDYPTPEIRDIRSLLSFKRKLKKQEHSHRMRIRNHLIAQYFPELDQYYNRRKQENLSIVKWCLSPADISDLELEKFIQMVTTSDGGVKQRQHLTSIWQESFKSIGCEFSETVGFEAKMLVSSLKDIRKIIAETNSRIEMICCQLPGYNVLLSIPGFGPVISAMTVGALGNPFRFNNARQVIKMAGLDLSASRSGKNSNNVTPSISKKGKAELRYGLYQAAFVASTKNKHFIAYFINQLQGRERESGIKTKMRVKLSAKMLVLAWTLMKKNEDFDPKYLNSQITTALLVESDASPQGKTR